MSPVPGSRSYADSGPKNSNPSLGRSQESPALRGGGEFSHETIPAEIREQFVTLKP